MKALAPFVVCAVLTAPGLVLAQAAPTTTPVNDRPAETFEEIERGLYFSVSAGPSFILNPPAPSDKERPFSPGQGAQLEVGVDLGERLSLGLFVWGTSNRAGSEYVGFSNGAASGDFSMLATGAVVRAHRVGFEDAQGVQRTWLYVRGGAGYALFRPKQLLPDSDILVFAGPGLEYYTRLRHFSVGVEVTGTFLVSSQSFGFGVMPNLRYAF